MPNVEIRNGRAMNRGLSGRKGAPTRSACEAQFMEVLGLAREHRVVCYPRDWNDITTLHWLRIPAPRKGTERRALLWRFRTLLTCFTVKAPDRWFVIYTGTPIT